MCACIHQVVQSLHTFANEHFDGIFPCKIQIKKLNIFFWVEVLRIGDARETKRYLFMVILTVHECFWILLLVIFIQIFYKEKRNIALNIYSVLKKPIFLASF